MGRPTNEERAARAAAVADEMIEEVATPKAYDEESLLAQVLNRLVDMAESSKGLSKQDLTDVMTANSEGIRKALKPENATHPDVSAFNPLGERDHPRPALKFKKVYWANVVMHPSELRREEIELFNSVEHNLEARNGTWKAEIKKNGGESELWITFPFDSIDNRMDLPSMEVLMMELLGGTRAVDPASLAQRVAELEKQLAAKG